MVVVLHNGIRYNLIGLLALPIHFPIVETRHRKGGGAKGGSLSSFINPCCAFDSVLDGYPIESN